MPNPPTIYDLRTRLGLSQSALARLLRISKRTIVRWEAGVTHPHHVYLDRIHRLLNDQLVQPRPKESLDGQAQR